MKTKEEIELEFRSTEPANFPGYSAPLSFRPMKLSDTAVLTPVLKKHGKSIRGYLGGFHNAHAWEVKDAAKFVAQCVDSPFPNFYYLFFIGNKVVGIGSIHPYANSLRDVQIVLAVFGRENQGKGIGTSIGVTLKKIALEIWGFDSFRWLVDATNHSSIKTAQKVGLEFDHSWEDELRHSELDSGLWMAFCQSRVEGTSKGILQGESLEYWTQPKHGSVLKAILDAKDRDKT